MSHKRRTAYAWDLLKQHWNLSLPFHAEREENWSLVNSVLQWRLQSQCTICCLIELPLHSSPAAIPVSYKQLSKYKNGIRKMEYRGWVFTSKRPLIDPSFRKALWSMIKDLFPRTWLYQGFRGIWVAVNMTVIRTTYPQLNTSSSQQTRQRKMGIKWRSE